MIQPRNRCIEVVGGLSPRYGRFQSCDLVLESGEIELVGVNRGLHEDIEVLVRELNEAVEHNKAIMPAS